MKEAQYQAKLVKKIKRLFPGCVLVKNDPTYQQGFPDWTLLYKDKWATLEVKGSMTSSQQPNQSYFITKLDSMSFAAFICPENEEDVLHALEQAFSA